MFFDSSSTWYCTGKNSIPSSCSKTGRTDLRLTEVQHPNTTATLSCCNNCFAFSANNGQLEAPSTTTGSICFPRTPPFLFISSKANNTMSRNDVSLIAIVPDNECRTPTLTLPLLRSTSFALKGAVQARDTIIAATLTDIESILLPGSRAARAILVLLGYFIFFFSTLVICFLIFAPWGRFEAGFSPKTGQRASRPYKREAG